MPKGNLSIELLGSPADFEKFILSSLEKQFDKAINKSLSLIKTGIAPIIYEAISGCDEIRELQNGQLRGELGLTSSQAQSAADEIAKAVSQSIEFNNTKASMGGKGGLSIYVQPSNFENVLSIGQSDITYYSRRYKGQVTLEWLDWLLKRGDAIIVGSFHFDPIAGKGRSGLGRMKETGVWRINSSYSGTEDDNFITRALGTKEIQKNMTSVISKVIAKNWD